MFIIKTSSWHYRLAQTYCPGWVDSSKGFCAYAHRVLWGMFWAAFTAVAIAFILAAPTVLLITAIQNLTGVSSLIQLLLGNNISIPWYLWVCRLSCYVDLVIIFISAIALFSYVTDTVKEKMYKEKPKHYDDVDEVEKPDSFIKIWWKSKMDRFCPAIKIYDDKE